MTGLFWLLTTPRSQLIKNHNLLAQEKSIFIHDIENIKYQQYW